MTGVHGNNICADVSSSLKISKEFFGGFFEQVRSVFTMLTYLLGGKGRVVVMKLKRGQMMDIAI